MNAKQERAIEAIRKEIVRRQSNGPPEACEFKTWKVTEDPDTDLVFLVSEYGSKTDEGTMASLICRDYRHFKIGPSGGVKLISLSTNLRTSDPGRDEGHGIFNACNWYHKPKKETK